MDSAFFIFGFQHTAARRRLVNCLVGSNGKILVSTHSRPKAAGPLIRPLRRLRRVSTHSRPKAAGMVCVFVGAAVLFQHTAARRRLAPFPCVGKPEFRFQHTAARRRLELGKPSFCNTLPFQHTAARRRLALGIVLTSKPSEFQHTAARRRLAIGYMIGQGRGAVSTHSRPKAAG